MFPPISLTRDTYLLSSDPTLLSLPAINAAFALPDLYWANPLSITDLQTLITNSFCLGLYLLPPSSSSSPPKQIGFARLVTDYVTTSYLTDVYVLPEHQGKGLGKWIMETIAEILKGMPEMRRSFLISGKGRTEKWYGEILDAHQMNPKAEGVTLHIVGPQSVERRGKLVGMGKKKD